MIRIKGDIEIPNFFDFKFSKVVFLPLIAIYYNATDYPNKYVARLWTVGGKHGTGPTFWVVVRDRLDDLRLVMPGNMERMDRKTNDDPNIVETWL